MSSAEQEDGAASAAGLEWGITSSVEQGDGSGNALAGFWQNNDNALTKVRRQNYDALTD